MFPFNGFPTIKDLLEGIGVPHVEIGAVLCDGEFVDWNINVKSNSRLTVYPHFLSILGLPMQLNPVYPNSEYSFIADVHLGKLSRFLRMIGFDTLYSSKFNDEEIIKKSNNEGRIILTRDKGILFNGSAHWGYFLRSQDSKVQFHEVLLKYGLPKLAKPLSRCIVCNGLIEEIPEYYAKQLIDYQIFNHNDCFYQCSNCGKVYWKGSHFRNMMDLVRRMVVRFK